MQEFWRFQLKPFSPKTIDIQKDENLQLIVNTDSRSMDEVDDESPLGDYIAALLQCQDVFSVI